MDGETAPAGKREETDGVEGGEGRVGLGQSFSWTLKGETSGSRERAVVLKTLNQI